MAATGSSLATEVNIYNNTVELYYIANDQTVQELSWNGVWNSENPSGVAGAPKPPSVARWPAWLIWWLVP